MDICFVRSFIPTYYPAEEEACQSGPFLSSLEMRIISHCHRQGFHHLTKGDLQGSNCKILLFCVLYFYVGI